MMNIGGLEILVVMLVMYAIVALILYWIIRLAVRHGIQDTRRPGRADRAVAGVDETIRRQQATYGGSEPE